MKTEHKRSSRLTDLRRMLKTRLGQVQDRGLGTVLREGVSRLARSPRLGTGALDDFDKEFGTDTSGIIQPWALDIPEDLLGQAIQYGTAQVEGFTALLSSLDIEYQRYSFVDLGSGKGRAILLASRYAFRQITGVELSTQLHQTSLVNIQRFRADWQRCTDIASVCENAAEFDFPPNNAVIYLFNPFGAQTLRAVVTNLELSIRAVPRRVFIIYVKPVHRVILDRSHSFSLLSNVQDDLIYVNDSPELIRA